MFFVFRFFITVFVSKRENKKCTGDHVNDFVFHILFYVFMFSFLTTNGRVCSLLPTTDGRVGNCLGFYSVYGTLVYLTASFGCINSLDGLGY
jgi:hypothetical protein